MKVRDYIDNNATNPFIDATATHDDSFFYSDSFQSMLTSHIYLRHGRKNIAESILDDCEEYETTPDVIIRSICEDIYNTNKYNYCKLFSVYGLEYDPLFNWDRREDEFTSNVTGEQKNTHKLGAGSVTNSYGSRMSINTTGDQTHTNEYDKIHSEAVKGESEQAHIYGKTDEQYITGEQSHNTDFGGKLTTSVKGEQNNVSTYGEHKETLNKGSQENVNTFGKVEESSTKGAMNTQNSYGAKTEIESLDSVNQTDVVGGKTKTNNYGEQTEASTIGVEHKMNEESVSVGVSSFDDASDFGNSGITTEQGTGNYLISNNGDGAYNPKERTYTDRTENTAGRTDGRHVSAHYDSEIIGNSTDTHTTDARTNVKSNTGYSDSVQEGSRQDSKTTKAHSDSSLEGQRLDIKETDSYSDSVKDGRRVDSTEEANHSDVLTDSQRTDSKTVNAHSDSIIDGSRVDTNETDARTDTQFDSKRVDSVEQIGYNDTISRDAVENEDIQGKRADSFSRHYYGRGNVGTTTSQDMVLQEAELADKIKKILDIMARDIISQIACTVY